MKPISSVILKNSSKAWKPRSITLATLSLTISRSISCILPKVSMTSAVSVVRGRYSSSEGSFRLMSKEITVPFFNSRNSLSSRAISVLPTSGRGEQMM